MDTSTIGSPEKLLNIFQGYPKQLVAVKTVDRVVWLLAREVMGVLQLQSSLFEPFSQALRRAKAVAGRGLGLAIATAIAGSRDWELALESTADQQGAMFSARLSAEVGTPG